MEETKDILCSVEVCPAMSKKSGGLTIGAEAHIHDQDDGEDIGGGGYDV